MKRRPAQLAGILAIAVLAAPKGSAGPGDGIRLGEVVFHPYLTIGLTYDDNVFRSSPDEPVSRAGVAPEDVAADTEVVADAGAAPASETQVEGGQPTPSDVRIGLELGASALNTIAGGRGAVSFDASAYQSTYQDFSTEDGEVFRLRLGVRYATARDVSLSLADEIRIRTGGGSSSTTDRSESTGNRLSAGVFWPVGQRTGLEFSAADDRVEYQSKSLTGTQELNLGVNAHYRAFTRTSTFLGYRHGWVTRDEGTNVTTRGDATYDQVNAGVSGVFSPRMRGRVSLGYQRRTYDNKTPQVEEVSEEEIALLRSLGIEQVRSALPGNETTAWVGGAGLSYSFQDRTTADLSASQSINESAISANNEYLSTSLSLSLTHRLPSGLSIQGRVGYGLIDYQQKFLVYDPPPEGVDGPGTPQLKSRADNQYSLGLRIGYRLTDWANAGLAFTHVENTSDFAGSEYESNLYTASLTARY